MNITVKYTALVIALFVIAGLSIYMLNRRQLIVASQLSYPVSLDMVRHAPGSPDEVSISKQYPVNYNKPGSEAAAFNETAANNSQQCDKLHNGCGAQKSAEEELLHNDAADLTQNILSAAIKEFESGKPEAGSTILSSLLPPATIEEANTLLNILLAQDGTDYISYPLPEEVRSAIRKALRTMPDAERAGKYMAQVYLELQDSGKTVAADELLNGVAHPAMLAELMVQAQTQGQSEVVANLSDRLITTNNVGVIGAVARLASSQPSLLDDASEILFNWSHQHPQIAQPGLFAEYLDNQSVPPEQRVVAAFGFAGLVGKAEARKALGKAISFETDQNTRGYLVTAMANLESGGDAPPPRAELQK